MGGGCSLRAHDGRAEVAGWDGGGVFCDGRIGQGDGDAGGTNEGTGFVDGDRDEVMARAEVCGHGEVEDKAAAEQIDKVGKNLWKIVGRAEKVQATGLLDEGVERLLGLNGRRVLRGESKDADVATGCFSREGGPWQLAFAVVAVGYDEQNAAARELSHVLDNKIDGVSETDGVSTGTAGFGSMAERRCDGDIEIVPEHGWIWDLIVIRLQEGTVDGVDGDVILRLE